ncbi:MAG: isochorismatase family protein [Deltaproteobacteria bacterium]|nr:isochorismatase family protein [Deltaproteobacteria bacterium]
MPIWDDVLTERDKEIMKRAGYGRRIGLGRRPVLLVIDMTYNFIGDRPEPIMESIKRFRQSCGEQGWRALYKIRDLLSDARQKNVPIFYTKAFEKAVAPAGIPHKTKNLRAQEDFREEWRDGNQIAQEIAPEETDVVVQKPNRSAFFGTPLMSMLNELHADTVLVTGCTTSGCVRATVMDAFAYKFRVAVVEECVFDRIEISHKVGLFDLSMKYADVISFNEAAKYIRDLRPPA